MRLKNKTQLEGVRASCRLLAQLFKELKGEVQPGRSTKSLDTWVQAWIKEAGGIPAFLNYGDKSNPFPAALCVSVNEEVIHGIPGNRILQNGDLVSLDCGINLNGYFSDMAMSVEVGSCAPEIQKLNQVTRECRYQGIGAIKMPGGRINDISRAVMQHAQQHGYGVVTAYCGHGVGFAPHEEPSVPNVPYLRPNPRLQNGLVIAIEPMINLGSHEVDHLDDGWTVLTADGKASAHWEHTVAIVDGQVEVLTEV